MSIVNIRVSDDEKRVFEKLEDDYDLKIFDEYEKEKQAGTLKTRPINELWDELGL